MTNIPLCPICTYHEATPHLYSLLGTAGICVHCYEARAEEPVQVHRAVLDMHRKDTPEPLRRSIVEQLKMVKCWVSWEEGYLDLDAYYDRMRRQQLTVVRPTFEDVEDDEMAKRMAAKIIKTAPNTLERRHEGIVSRVRTWLVSLADGWRHAVDAGL